VNTVETLPPPGEEPLLKPHEVAQLLRVDPRTVSNWARNGKLRCIRTVGGHRRFPESDVRALLVGLSIPQQPTSMEQVS
jgi:excisionase family DNA binding protein